MNPASPANLWIGRTDRPYTFTSPFPGCGFALLLMSGDEDVTPDEQWQLSRQIVEEGCRYAVCAGFDCSSWHDSIDMVCVIKEVDGRPPPFVMTTWHEDESLEEVAEFFATCTSIDDRRPGAFAVLIVGGPDSLEKEVRTAVMRAF